MTTCDKWDIAVVPFPFVDSHQSKTRPAFVLSNKTFNSSNHHSIMGMITTMKSYSWPSDIPIHDWENAGLPCPSIARMKIFTIDNRLIIKKAGKLSTQDQQNIQTSLKTNFSL